MRWRVAGWRSAADLPPQGGDVAEGDRGDRCAWSAGLLFVSTRAPALGVRRPPLACRPSPPQGGRLAASPISPIIIAEKEKGWQSPAHAQFRR
ncbi:hypothetical protein EOB59_30755 [Mesorhizobium sp. M7A.F.Ca.MR.176.00.0.0]|nr:hypothetical protein EOB59_30755 [Mesorhizobium sp. M7A.F.Ca.MR.176.00.0.0]